MTDIELDRFVTLKQAAELMGVSVQTVRREYRHKFIRLSPRRLGMRVRDVLILENIDGQKVEIPINGPIPSGQGSVALSIQKRNLRGCREKG